VSERFEPILDFARRARKAILAIGLAVAVAAGVAITQIPFESDVMELIPQSGPAVRNFKKYVERFDSLDYVYVLLEAPEGRSVSDYEDVIETYIVELRALPQIEYVDAALLGDDRDWSYLLDRVLLLLGPDAAEEALGRFEPDGMAEALSRAREALAIPSVAMRELVRQDPLGLVLGLREKFAANKSFSLFDPSQEGYVSADGGSRLVIAKPKGPALDADFCKELLDGLDEVERRVRVETAPPADDGDGETLPPIGIEIAGAYRNTHEADTLIRGEMKLNTAVSLFLLLTVIFLVFRSHWILFCAATTLGLAGLLAIVLIGLARGDLLAAASGGAAMLFGLGMDGIMLLYVRFLEERSRGADPETATRRLSPTVGSVLLGYITSVATFAALMFIDFPSLEELGRLVGLGMLLCAGLTLLFVPAVLGFVGASASASRAPHLPRLSAMVERRPRMILVAAAVMTIGSLWALPKLVVVASLERIQPKTAGAAVEAKLQERFQFPKQVVLVLAESAELDAVIESQRSLERAIAARGETVPLSNALAFLPTAAEQAEVRALVEASQLTASDVWPRFEQAANAAGFRPGVFDGFRRRLSTLVDSDEEITYDGLLAHGFGPLASRFIARGDDGYMATTYLYPETAAEASRVAQLVTDIDASLLVTGPALINSELRASLLPQFLTGVVIGSVFVVLLIYLGFRSVRATLWCLLPTVLGLLWAAGLFAAIGIELDLFSVFGIVMVIGIGVDYGIHIMHRCQLDGREAILQFLPWTGAAIALAAVTTVIGFGTVALSSYAPLGRLGVVSATSVVFVAFASLLVLPVLLRGKRP
jgi:hypothetical protein